MQLDATSIAIRERGLLEIFDLSLLVFRRWGGMILLTTFLGALPFAILFDLLIGPMADPLNEIQPRYLWTMLLLVFIAAPWATTATTLYLGQVMFNVQPRAGRMLRDLLRMTGPLLIVHGLVRGVGLAILLALFIDHRGFSQAADGWLIILAMYLCVLRGLRPFVSEIITLERNPLSAQGPQALSSGRRSKLLHGPSSADLFARWLGSALLCVVIGTGLVLFAWYVSGLMFGHWYPWNQIMFRVVYPGVLWVVAALFAVVRFLNYLDLRIRREGWEVELRMRAEATRMARQVV